jgi:hypothetical protein
MVVGPTPPGTGVIRLATDRASENATSPTVPFVVAGVYDHCPRLDPITSDKVCPSHRCHHDVGATHGGGKILCAGVAVGDHGVSGKKRHPDRLSENRAPADHHGMLSRWINVIGIKKAHDARRRARGEPGKPRRAKRRCVVRAI